MNGRRGEYPAHLARERHLADGRAVLIRPVRAEDESRELEFLSQLSAETRQLRFMKYVGAISDRLVHFFTHIDYDRHMAFVCDAKGAPGGDLVGEARYLGNPDGRSCEFGIVIADDWHGSGIAGLLMDALMRAAQARGFETMEGIVMRENRDMLHFVKALGFEVELIPEDPKTVRVLKKL